MPIVFVHGNPETAAVWAELASCLQLQDALFLSPPGFGAPVPAGFGATADEYLDWLARALAELNGPVDLIGHDWGGVHVMRIAMEHPELIRSWVSDAAGAFDSAYVWHELAQVWQTPGKGEEAIAMALAAAPGLRAKRYEALGMSSATASAIANAFCVEMSQCILPLYRSAAQPALMNWGRHLAAASARPGLVLHATEDLYVGGEALHRRAAAAAGARYQPLPGLGHWWMSQGPERCAPALLDFWSGLA